MQNPKHCGTQVYSSVCPTIRLFVGLCLCRASLFLSSPPLSLSLSLSHTHTLSLPEQFKDIFSSIDFIVTFQQTSGIIWPTNNVTWSPRIPTIFLCRHFFGTAFDCFWSALAAVVLIFAVVIHLCHHCLEYIAVVLSLHLCCFESPPLLFRVSLKKRTSLTKGTWPLLNQAWLTWKISMYLQSWSKHWNPKSREQRMSEEP